MFWCNLRQTFLLTFYFRSTVFNWFSSVSVIFFLQTFTFFTGRFWNSNRPEERLHDDWMKFYIFFGEKHKHAFMCMFYVEREIKMRENVLCHFQLCSVFKSFLSTLNENASLNFKLCRHCFRNFGETQTHHSPSCLIYSRIDYSQPAIIIPQNHNLSFLCFPHTSWKVFSCAQEHLVTQFAFKFLEVGSEY